MAEADEDGDGGERRPDRAPAASRATSSVNCRLRGDRRRRQRPPPRSSSVSPHQTISITTITVVICMIFSASSLDSWMPLVFRHQK